MLLQVQTQPMRRGREGERGGRASAWPACVVGGGRGRRPQGRKVRERRRPRGSGPEPALQRSPSRLGRWWSRISEAAEGTRATAASRERAGASSAEEPEPPCPVVEGERHGRRRGSGGVRGGACGGLAEKADPCGGGALGGRDPGGAGVGGLSQGEVGGCGWRDLARE
jgi:hypothetical protein